MFCLCLVSSSLIVIDIFIIHDWYFNVRCTTVLNEVGNIITIQLPALRWHNFASHYIRLRYSTVVRLFVSWNVICLVGTYTYRIPRFSFPLQALARHTTGIKHSFTFMLLSVVDNSLWLLYIYKFNLIFISSISQDHCIVFTDSMVKRILRDSKRYSTLWYIKRLVAMILDGLPAMTLSIVMYGCYDIEWVAMMLMALLWYWVGYHVMVTHDCYSTTVPCWSRLTSVLLVLRFCNTCYTSLNLIFSRYTLMLRTV